MLTRFVVGVLNFRVFHFRWDMQRIRELRRVEYLKEGRNRHHLQNTNDDDKEELTTLLPNLSDIKAIEITDNLPVSAFGSNLHVKKKIEPLVHISFFDCVL